MGTYKNKETVAIIRDYVTRDFPAVEALLKANKDMYYSEIDTKETYRKKVKHEPGSIIIAEINGKIVGMVMYIFDPWLSFGYHLVVDVNYRGQGIGTQLIKEATRRIKCRGGKQVSLFVHTENESALSLYTKEGCANLGLYFCLTKRV